MAHDVIPQATTQISARRKALAPQTPDAFTAFSKQQVMEAIWVAAEMRAGGAYAHAAIAIDALSHDPAPADAKPGASMVTSSG
jgi:hypothetical protein